MRPILAVAVLVLAGACSDDGADRTAPAGEEPAGARVADPVNDTLERARSVEDTLREAAEERRRQVEAQE